MEEKEFIENKFGYQVAISEMQKYLDGQYQSVSAVKNVVEQILGAASLIIAIIGALQLFNARIQPQYQAIYNGLIVVTVILYIVLIASSIWVLSPTEVKGPISADWDELYKGYVGHENEIDILKQQLSNYLNAIKLNDPIIIKRSRRTWIPAILLPVIVILVFSLSLLPRIPIP
jgi:hypothetical protein